MQWKEDVVLYNIHASCLSQALLSLGNWFKINFNTKVEDGSVNKHK